MQVRHYCDLPIITGRNEVVAKVMFLHVSVILFMGGLQAGRIPPWTGRTPPGRENPPGREEPPLDRENPSGPGRPPQVGRTPHIREEPPPEADSRIQSTSGRYASYWNAFLFSNSFLSKNRNVGHSKLLQSTLSERMFIYFWQPRYGKR